MVLKDHRNAAISYEQQLFTSLVDTKSFHYCWSGQPSVIKCQDFELGTQPRLLFRDPMTPNSLEDVLSRYKKWKMWLSQKNLSPQGHEKFTSLVKASDRQLNDLCCGSIKLNTLDLELIALAKLVLQEKSVVGFRFPTQECQSLYAAAIECIVTRDKSEETRPIAIYASDLSGMHEYLSYNDGKSGIGKYISCETYNSSADESANNNSRDIPDILTVRKLVHLASLCEDIPPSLILAHISLAHEVEDYRRIIENSIRLKIPALLVYSPSATSIEQVLQEKGVPSWEIPRASLNELLAVSKVQDNYHVIHRDFDSLSLRVAAQGWQVNPLPITDKELNLATIGVFRELLRLAKIAPPNQDLELDRVLHYGWEFLKSIESLSSSVSVFDQIAPRTYMNMPLTERLATLIKWISRFKIAHPDRSEESAYLARLCDLLLTRLQNGSVGLPAATLQLVTRSMEKGKPLVLVFCTRTMAIAADAFIQDELSRQGHSVKNSWLAITVADMSNSTLPELLKQGNIKAVGLPLISIPTCRHKNHRYLFGLPLSHQIVTFLYQSQAESFRRLFDSACNDDVDHINAERCHILRKLGRSPPSIQVKNSRTTNIMVSQFPEFTDGLIHFPGTIGDVSREVLEELTGGHHDALTQEDFENREMDSSDLTEQPANSEDNPQIAIPLLLDDEFRVFVLPGHRVFVLEDGGTEVCPIRARDLSVGDMIVTIEGSVAYTITQRLLHELSKQPEWSTQVRFRSMWVEAMRQWASDPSHTTKQLLAELAKLGSTIRNENTVKYWIEGDVVIGPRDPDDIIRIAEVCKSKALSRYSDMVISSIENLRKVHELVKEKVIHNALKSHAAKAVSSSITLNPIAEDSVEKFVKDIRIYKVTGIDPLRNVHTSFLNSISSRT